MSKHRFYPTKIHTVQPRSRQFFRFLRWLALFMTVVLMVLGAAVVIVHFWTVEAQLDNAFMQGMSAGYQMCPKGV